MSKKANNPNKLKAKDYIIYILIALGMIFLSSSFVVESVYNQASRVAVTPEGIKEVYEVCIGNRSELSGANASETEENVTTDEAEPTPSPTVESTPTAEPSPTAQPSPTTP